MTGRVPTAAAVGIALALLTGGALRGVWLTSDPPTYGAVGIVWHDEGAWLHNARNRALWGRWRTDQWNPVFVAPVFTALEYETFRLLGVGTWQARIVPAASGLLAVGALALGLWATTGPRAALIGACLLSTNYVFVMWNRAALMESTMSACIVAAWAAYAMVRWSPAFGTLAGTMATLAWFTKAAAAFFILAIVADSVLTLALAHSQRLRRLTAFEPPPRADVRGAWAMLLGLSVSALCLVVLFVAPHWHDYSFYNWQMSVLRKPSYTARAVLDRLSWLPFVQGFFTRMGVELLAGSMAVGLILTRVRRASPSERLVVSWVLIGFLELVVHDAGNERRYVMLVPALIALTSILLGGVGARPLPRIGRLRWCAWPVAVFLCYLVLGTFIRLALLPDVVAGRLSEAVRLSALLAACLGTAIVWQWRPLAAWLTADVLPGAGVAALTALIVIGDLVQFSTWAWHRTDLNYRASVLVGRLLPPGTLVHGKLANGLSLENRIRPVFVGRRFGNYDDRTSRDDVRYVLTYLSPSVGYEGRVIRDVLAAYPCRSVIARFAVAETGPGDRAALIDKFGAPDCAAPQRQAPVSGPPKD